MTQSIKTLIERLEKNNPPALLSMTPVHDGDGYGYGGDWVVTIDGRSIVLGPRDGAWAGLIVEAVNKYIADGLRARLELTKEAQT